MISEFRNVHWKTLAAALTVLACTTPLAGQARAAGGSIVVAQSADVLTLDPTANTSALAINVYQNIFDQLTEIRADGTLGPRLAESWEINSDATVWTFKLVANARFHDGSPVTADDIVGTFDAILANAKSPVRSYLGTVSKTEKVDEHTVRITLKEPFITFGRQVSLVSVLPIRTYKEMGPEKFSLMPIGSGPYKVKEWIKDSHVALEAFPDYWRGAAKTASVTFRAVPSEPARAAGLAAGELDVVPVLPPPLVASLSQQPAIKIEKVESNRTVFIGYNAKATGPLQNEKIRQAIDHAIDRNAITTRLLQGLGKPVGQIAAPIIFGHDPSIKPSEYNPDLAKKLLAEAGYDGTPIDFEYPTNRWAFANETAQAISGYLTKAGIKVNMKPMEYSAFFPLWLQNKLGSMYMFALGITVMDADLVLNLEYESGVSHGYWTSPEVDALAKEQRASTDEAKRKQLMGKVWKISQEKAIFSPLYVEIQAYGVRDCPHWKPRGDERLNFWSAESTCKH